MADFSEIAKTDCIEKTLPDNAELNDSHTLVLQSVLNAIKAHGRSSMNKEVCGVLVGSLYWDKAPYLLIDVRIEGKFAQHQAGSVTFTSETWNYIHSELAEKHPGEKIVGWYHTHPGFGVFLSNMDFFIHENFFGIKWQPAYVFDPLSETEGFFFWHGNNLEPEKVPIIPDEEPVAKKPAINAGEKISIALTKEEEIKENKARHAVYVLAVPGIIAGILAILACLYMHKTTHELELKLKNMSTATAKLEPQFKNMHKTTHELELELKKQSDSVKRQLETRKNRNSAAQAYKRRVEDQRRKQIKEIQNLQRQLETAQREIRNLGRQLAKLQERPRPATADAAVANPSAVTSGAGSKPGSRPIQPSQTQAPPSKPWYEWRKIWSWIRSWFWNER